MKDPLAEYKNRMLQFKRAGYDMMRARKFILDKASLELGSVLEIGTGKGHTAVGMALRRIKFTTIDKDTATLKMARKHLRLRNLSSYATIKKMNAERLRFQDGSFDCVISVNFLHHAKYPADCIREMCRVSRSKVVIADLNNRGSEIMEKVHKQEGRDHAKTRISCAGIRKVLEDMGFQVKVYRDKCQDVFIARKQGERK
ncbi:MAG: class I SAM-dependent methyltransferase [Candidatus Omnitrophica bacterium]|nr:class I SAM-dependent methyltransferase [Candidatus Omnitrophota bacterium]